MKNKVEACIHPTTDSNIRFEEKNRKIIFQNPPKKRYLRVDVDGCTLVDGLRCDKLLLSADELEERFVELKGTDVKHAIEQLESTINRLGEHHGNRHSYVICTNVAPALTTQIQKKQKHFKQAYHSELIIKEQQLIVPLN